MHKTALYFTSLCGDTFICCLKMREKYCGDLNPHSEHTSFTDFSVLRNSSTALFILI